MVPQIDWHPRQLARPSEWTLFVPGRPEPIAVVRKLLVRGRECFRAVTWAAQGNKRDLIGYYPNGDKGCRSLLAALLRGGRCSA